MCSCMVRFPRVPAGVGEEVGQLVEEAVEVTMVEGGDGQVLAAEEGALDTLQAEQLDTPSAEEAVNGAVETESEVKPSVDQLSAQIQPVQVGALSLDGTSAVQGGHCVTSCRLRSSLFRWAPCP